MTRWVGGAWGWLNDDWAKNIQEKNLYLRAKKKKVGIFFKKTFFLENEPELVCSFFSTKTSPVYFWPYLLTEPRWAPQPQGTQWFPRIGLFVVQAISLAPCRWPIEFLTSSHPCGHLSKIPNSQIHKVGKLKFFIFWPYGFDDLEFSANVCRGAMRSKTQ